MDSLLTSKMPSDNSSYPTQPEKPHHYTYLKEFRTQQCPLFLQHKCTQHRPFTCFHWHFLNQRRRRPIRKRDGTFNYNPDVYCTKYDETTGICEEGDECPYLHRTAGDTERRYHLRYYKTGTCVHETDSKGHCVKNGPHCAFAHGIHDLRQPVYDIREITGTDASEKGPLESTATTQLEKDRMVNEDPKWNDTNYVLANYKTEQCKRPPRLCRQGYACPSYHNNRDRRRSPKKYKYRSTPCPNVKHGDDWGDPAQCENGDSCSYCHTRTEQQFHPEIYKSTKCNDMVQTSYCPRGPFCAFAHVEQEMTTQREVGSLPDNSLAAFVSNALPEDEKNMKENGDHKKDMTNGNITPTLMSPRNGRNHDSSLPEPIGKGRSNSMSSSQGGSMSGSMPNSDHFPGQYRMAPGSEREDIPGKLEQRLAAIDNDPNLDMSEKLKRKQNLLLMYGINIGSPGAANMILGLSPATSAMSPLARSFYPPGDTVESVVGNALDEDLNLGELSSSLDREFAMDSDVSETNAYNSGFSSNSYFGPTSLPVTIPSRVSNSSLVPSMSQSPISSPLGSLTNSYLAQPLNDQAKQEQQLQGAAAAFLSQPNPGKYSAPGFSDFIGSMSPRNSISQSPLITTAFSNGMANGGSNFNEVQRLREELAQNKVKMSQWEERISQARAACQAWQKEAEESAKKYSEDSKKYISQRDEALEKIGKLKLEVEHLRGGPFIHCLQRVSDLETLPLPLLRQMQTQLRMDLETLDKAISQSRPIKCVVCGEQNKAIVSSACNHCVMCEGCASKGQPCPMCQGPMSQPSNFLLPM